MQSDEVIAVVSKLISPLKEPRCYFFLMIFRFPMVVEIGEPHQASGEVTGVGLQRLSLSCSSQSLSPSSFGSTSRVQGLVPFRVPLG